MKKLNVFKRRWIIFRLSIMSQTKRPKYLKKKQIFAEFGENCKWASKLIPSEPYLVKIHNNVNIASNVTFCTHDIIDSCFIGCPQYSNIKDYFMD